MAAQVDQAWTVSNEDQVQWEWDSDTSDRINDCNQSLSYSSLVFLSSNSFIGFKFHSISPEVFVCGGEEGWLVDIGKKGWSLKFAYFEDFWTTRELLYGFVHW